MKMRFYNKIVRYIINVTYYVVFCTLGRSDEKMGLIWGFYGFLQWTEASRGGGFICDRCQTTKSGVTTLTKSCYEAQGWKSILPLRPEICLWTAIKNVHPGWMVEIVIGKTGWEHRGEDLWWISSQDWGVREHMGNDAVSFTMFHN